MLAARGDSIVDAPASRRFLWASVVAGSLAAMALCCAIGARSLAVGSREGQWIYGYFTPHDAAALGSVLAATLAASAACCALLAASDLSFLRPAWAIVLAWTAVALGVQALLRALTPFSFEQLFFSDGANSFYGVTRHYVASTILRDFDSIRASLPLHAQSNMPGKVMLVYALRYLSTSPDVLAWLVVVVSNLGGALMYLFVRDLFNDGRTALFAAILYFFVPGKMFFFPLLNTVTPVVVLGCGCLFSRWLRTGRGVYALCLGAAVYALAFFEPLGLSSGLLFAVLAGRALWRGSMPARTLLRHGTLAALGFAAGYATLEWTFGFDLAGALRQIGAAARAFNGDAGRPYAIWVRADLVECVVGMGVCQAVLAGAALVDGLRADPRGPAPAGQVAGLFGLGLIAMLGVLDLSGINRGEVTRLWIFVACFFQIPAAYVCARLESRTALALVLSVTLAEDALGTAMIGFVSP